MIHLGLNLTFRLMIGLTNLERNTVAERCSGFDPIFDSASRVEKRDWYYDRCERWFHASECTALFQMGDPISGESMVVLFTWPSYGEIKVMEAYTKSKCNALLMDSNMPRVQLER